MIFKISLERPRSIQTVDMIFLNSNTIEIQIILEYQSAYATPNHKQSLQIGLDVLLFSNTQGWPRTRNPILFHHL